jgi:uncharacterized protein YdeI (YjbR/CyaY-like superfamily)
MKPRFFQSAAELRRWLHAHHDRDGELWVGFYKKASGKGGLTYAEALDQALCYGWIDGLKKRVDEAAYTHRFSPRTAKSIWSFVNTKRAEELKRLGLMQPPGLAAFEKRDPMRSGAYSFESQEPSLLPAYLRTFKADPRAWTFFTAQPPGYRRIATHWVMSAKQDATRERRLAQLIQASSTGVRVGSVIGRHEP